MNNGTPKMVSKNPGKSNASPSSNSSLIRSTVRQGNIPCLGIMSPGTSISSPGLSIPRPGLSIPRPGLSIPTSGLSIPTSGLSIPRPGLGIPRPGLGIPRPGLGIPRPGLGIPRPGLGIPRPGLGIPRPGLGIPRSRLSIPRPGLSIPRPGLSIPRPGLGIQRPELSIQRPTISTANSKSETETFLKLKATNTRTSRSDLNILMSPRQNPLSQLELGLTQRFKRNTQSECQLSQNMNNMVNRSKRTSQNLIKNLKITEKRKNKKTDDNLLETLVKPDKIKKRDELQKIITQSEENTKRRKITKEVKIIEYEPQNRNFRAQNSIHVEKEAVIDITDINLINDNCLNEPTQQPDAENFDFNIDESANIRQLLEQMIDLSEELKESIANNVEEKVKNENKMEIGSRSFFDKRDDILDIFVKAAFDEKECSKCKAEALINCNECGMICTAHDILIHSEHPLHTRYAGSLKLEAGVTVDKTRKNLVGFQINLPVSVKKICECGQVMIRKSNQELVKCMDISGCFEANGIDFHCTCCATVVKCTLIDLFASKLFPLDCSENSKLVVTFPLLELWEKLKNNCPPLGLGSFIKSVLTNSLAQVKQSEFDQIYQQFINLKFKLGQALGENYSDCPAKKSKNSRLHTDGNSKLNRFFSKNQRKNLKTSYFNDAVIMNDEQVINEIEKYKKEKFVTSKKSDTLCGESNWKAASNRTQSGSVLDEKGINFVACSHYVVVQAVNQPSGELFCLHSMSISNIAQRGYQVADVALDVACKFVPWTDRLQKNVPLQQSLQFPPLQCNVWIGDVHCKGHCIWCAILYGHKWNGVGRGSAGEQVEVLNSSLSQLRFRTRFMGSNRRNDEITEFILYKNKERDGKIVSDILKTLERFDVECESMKSELALIEGKHNFNMDENKIELIKSTAAKVKSAKKNDIEEKIETFALNVIYKRHQLKTTVDTSMRNKVKKNLIGASQKLTDAISAYNKEETGEISWDNALLGIFPWNFTHFPIEMKENPVIFIKAAEIFLKLKRTQEERIILMDDIEVILEKRVQDIENLDRQYEGEIEWQKARFLQSALLKEQLQSEIQLIRCFPSLIILPKKFENYLGKSRPLFRCIKEKSPDEVLDSVEVELLLSDNEMS